LLYLIILAIYFLVLIVANTAGAVFRLALLTAYKSFELTRNKALEI